MLLEQQYVRDLIILRSVVTFTITSILYILTYILLFLPNRENGLTFFDQNAWFFIFCISFIYPVNQLPLFLVFEFIDKILTFWIMLDK